MSIYLSYLPCPRQLSRYSSPAANGKVASFSAASCWCGVIWIWRYQRHSTACDDTDTDASASLLPPVHQRLAWLSSLGALMCLWQGRCARSEIQTADARLPPQLAVKQRDTRLHWWRHFYGWHSEHYSHTSMTLPLIDIHRLSRCLIYTESYTREILNRPTAGTLYNLKCKIKYRYQGTLK